MDIKRPKVDGLVFVCLFVLLSVCVVSYIVLFKAANSAGGEDSAAISTTPTVTTSAAKPVTTPAPAPATKTATPTTSATPTPATSAKPTSTTPAPKAQPPAGAVKCGESDKFTAYAGNDTTSCPFVENIAKAMDKQAGATKAVKVKANSPTTKKTYEVTCTPGKAKEFVCSGGDSGVAHLLPR